MTDHIRDKKKNNLKVEPIKLESILPASRILGYDMFSEIYSNIFLCAKKKKGKTNTLFYILTQCAGIYKVDEAGVHRSKIWIFASTVHKDDNWSVIRKWANDRGFEHVIVDDISQIKEIADSLASPETKEEKSKTNPLSEYLEQPKEKKKKYTQPSKIAPENIFIFDDMSKALRHKEMSAFLKKNRHFKSKMIISSQYPNDLDVQGRMQLDYWILFSGHTDNKLEEILRVTDIDISFDKFKALYKHATSAPFSFLYIDVNGPEFRKCFDTELLINSD